MLNRIHRSAKMLWQKESSLLEDQRRDSMKEQRRVVERQVKCVQSPEFRRFVERCLRDSGGAPSTICLHV